MKGDVVSTKYPSLLYLLKQKILLEFGDGRRGVLKVTAFAHGIFAEKRVLKQVERFSFQGSS